MWEERVRGTEGEGRREAGRSETVHRHVSGTILAIIATKSRKKTKNDDVIDRRGFFVTELTYHTVI